MNHSSSHLPGVRSERIRSGRLETRVLRSGDGAGQPVLFLHGNLSSATFWEETMLELPLGFAAFAPDLRGYGLSDPTALINATRGVADWADDAVALADQFGWDRFHLVAHSLGGCVAWRLLGDHADRLRSVVLISPGPPGGFGGTQGPTGTLNHEDGAGSGAGLVQLDLIDGLRERDMTEGPLSPRTLMNRLYWHPEFRPAREEAFLTAMFQTHLGERQFPGDWIPSPHWPGFAPGEWGPINAMSPRHNRKILERLEGVPGKPPLLWIHGREDAIVSDSSFSDAGYQGQLGLRPDWPGADVFPSQPMIQQLTHALDCYEQTGGKVQRLTLPGVGHTPYLERAVDVQAAMRGHLKV